MNSSISSQIDAHLQDGDAFFAQCVQSLRDHTDQQVDGARIAEVRKQVEAAIGTYNAGQIAQSLAMFSAIVDRSIVILARPKCKNIVDLIFTLFPDQEQFSESCRFRLKIICALHDMPPFNNPEIDMKAAGLLTHKIKKPLPALQFRNIAAAQNPQRIEVAERILGAYHKALEDQNNALLKRQDADLWTAVLDKELGELVEVIEQKNAPKLASYLINFGTTPREFGGVTTCRDKDQTEHMGHYYIGLTYFDKLISLAESLGLLPVERLQSPHSGVNFHTNIDDLVKKIESHLSISIIPPMGIIYTDGIVAGEGLLHNVHINGLYNATRTRALNPAGEPCCEYGGGIGIAAMYGRRLGMMDYTIFDLPITNLLAAHYLLHALGPDAVSLYGEQLRKDTIKILPFWEVMNAQDKQFYLSVNQDSFPEISEKLVAEYLTQIRRTTSKYFLSLNHESFSPYTVNNLVQRTSCFESFYRSKYWIYEGYVEELFMIDTSQS